MRNKTEKRNGTIDFFRFVFAAGIVFYHARPLIQQELFVCGYIGVEFFFLVSGYLLMKKAREASFLPGETGAEPGGSGDIFEENLKMLCHKLRGYTVSPVCTSLEVSRYGRLLPTTRICEISAVVSMS